jgi:hypothetical protein
VVASYRLGLACLSLLAPATGSPAAPTPLTGTVVGGDSATRSFYMADSRGQVFLVLARQAVPDGAIVRVRGDRLPNGWTISSTGLNGSVTRIGQSARALVRGELGFVDVEKLRFQLAAHGQIVGDVAFPAKLADPLRRIARAPPHAGDLLFRLSIRTRHLRLAALPS